MAAVRCGVSKNYRIKIACAIQIIGCVRLFFSYGWFMENLTYSEIIDRLGVAAIASRVGVTSDAVKIRRTQGSLPASWYHALCDMAGETLPISQFTFKGIGAGEGAS